MSDVFLHNEPVLRQPTDIKWGKGCCPACGAPEGYVCRSPNCYMLNLAPPPSADLVSMETQLRKALRLAVAMLAQHEPKDSRAVSDAFVALAMVNCGMATEESWKIIEERLDRLP